MEEGHIARPLPPGRVLALTAAGFVAATLIFFGAILPAEYNRDPLGLGQATGLSRLWAPAEVEFQPEAGTPVLARNYANPFRTDTVEIPLRADGDRTRGNQLEYKVRMREGETLIYSWAVETIPNEEEFYFDFHGHTDTPEQETMTVASYHEDTGTHAHGAMTAPFDGVHGWYFQNQSVNPVVVRVTMSGFYELIPPGDTGNESGIYANVPASEAFGPPLE